MKLYILITLILFLLLLGTFFILAGKSKIGKGIAIGVFLLLLIGAGLIFGNERFNWLDVKIADFTSKKYYDEFSSAEIVLMERGKYNPILFSKNRNKIAYPASLTKMMTALVALDHIKDLDGVAPVDKLTYQRMVRSNASMAGFYGNEKTTYRDLLYGTLLASGGEAANSLAINVAGSTEKFVEMMNEKARELHLEHTHYSNPEGLQDSGEYSCATDVAKVLDYGLKNPTFRKIITTPAYQSTKTFDHPQGVMIYSTVLKWIDNSQYKNFEILGGKSGTTMDAGACWATYGKKNGKEYICVVMGAPLTELENKEKLQVKDTLELYDRFIP